MQSKTIKKRVFTKTTLLGGKYLVQVNLKKNKKAKFQIQ